MLEYRVLYEQEALDRFCEFIEYLRCAMYKRFSDTGLHGIPEILDQYDTHLSALEHDVFCECERLGKLSVIGTIYGETGNIRKTRLIFPIRSYSITAWCLADTQAGILTVESISIHT